MEKKNRTGEHNFNTTMRKKGSPHLIVFTPDPADPFFISVEVRKLKGGAIAASHYILKSDKQQWLTMFEADGFREVKETVAS